jgi:hypothetical protein
MPRKADELRALVPVMRDLGVIEYDGIRLLPPAPKAEDIELTEEEAYARQERIADMRHRIQFAHTSIKPIRPPSPRSPDVVVQRIANARGRGSGET